MLGQKHRYKGYHDYVELGIDEDIKRFYNKGNLLSVLGGKEFKAERKEVSEATDINQLRQLLQDRPTLVEMLEIISKLGGVSQKSIYQRISGKRKNHPLRAFAMYACQYYGNIKHQEIATYFGLTHVGSVSNPINRIKSEIANGGWKSEIKTIEKTLYIV